MSELVEIAVRMGEIAVSKTAGEVLVSLGLGSCIGLALVDQRRGIAGLAHIMLPEAIAGGGPAGKFADLAVPELVARTVALGTSRPMLKAVLVGGAQMFSLGGSGAMDIGVRNDEAVRAVLASRAAGSDTALILDSELRVEGEECSLSFLLLPEPGGVREILARMGVDA